MTVSGLNQKTHGRPALSFAQTCTMFAVLAVVLTVADRLTKAWAIANVADGADFIPGLVNFVLVYNQGASFGTLQGATLLLLVVSAIICVLILVYVMRYRRHRAYEVAGLACVFAGAVGNAYDRLAFGQVTDFLHLEFFSFPVFNVADCCITVGVVLVLAFLLLDANSPFAVGGDADDPANVSKDGE